MKRKSLLPATLFLLLGISQWLPAGDTFPAAQHLSSGFRDAVREHYVPPFMRPQQQKTGREAKCRDHEGDYFLKPQQGETQAHCFCR